MGLFDKLRPEYKNSNPEVRIKAVKELNDENILIDLAKNDQDRRVRGEAVQKIMNQEVLMNIVENDTDSCVRRYAILNPNLKDQSFLFDYVNKVNEDMLKKTAIMRITDEKILAKLAKNPDRYVRQTAVQNPNLKDESLLIDIAKNDENRIVRAHAVSRITDNEVLIEIAKFDESTFVSQAVYDRIKDKSILEENKLTLDEVKKIKEEKVLMNIIKREFEDPEYDLSDNAKQAISQINSCINIVELAQLNYKRYIILSLNNRSFLIEEECTRYNTLKNKLLNFNIACVDKEDIKSAECVIKHRIPILVPEDIQELISIFRNNDLTIDKSYIGKRIDIYNSRNVATFFKYGKITK